MEAGFCARADSDTRRAIVAGIGGGKSLGYFKTNALLVGEILERLFTHRLSVTQMMGPVGIAQAAGEAAETEGWHPKFGLAAEISLQLGILNLLPFPILDGGMILLLLIESVLRHDISLVIKERIYTSGLCGADGLRRLHDLQRREQAATFHARRQTVETVVGSQLSAFSLRENTECR